MIFLKMEDFVDGTVKVQWHTNYAVLIPYEHEIK